MDCRRLPGSAFAVAVLAVALAAAVAAPLAQAQVNVTPAADQAALLASPDAHLAANKRLVFDFWREVLEGGHLDLAHHYLAEGYIQHNPNVPTGRAGFVAFFGKFAKPKPIAPAIKAPVVSIVAEGDLVVLSFASEHKDPKAAPGWYTTTWFDMFRIENGKIAEHWDSALKE
jgi:predicted SnoaL-like aldol condensation-catalyzing enzyme